MHFVQQFAFTFIHVVTYPLHYCGYPHTYLHATFVSKHIAAHFSLTHSPTPHRHLPLPKTPHTVATFYYGWTWQGIPFLLPRAGWCISWTAYPFQPGRQHKFCARMNSTLLPATPLCFDRTPRAATAHACRQGGLGHAPLYSFTGISPPEGRTPPRSLMPAPCALVPFARCAFISLRDDCCAFWRTLWFCQHWPGPAYLLPRMAFSPLDGFAPATCRARRHFILVWVCISLYHSTTSVSLPLCWSLLFLAAFYCACPRAWRFRCLLVFALPGEFFLLVSL